MPGYARYGLYPRRLPAASPFLVVWREIRLTRPDSPRPDPLGSGKEHQGAEPTVSPRPCYAGQLWRAPGTPRCGPSRRSGHWVESGPGFPEAPSSVSLSWHRRHTLAPRLKTALGELPLSLGALALSARVCRASTCCVLGTLARPFGGARPEHEVPAAEPASGPGISAVVEEREGAH